MSSAVIAGIGNTEFTQDDTGQRSMDLALEAIKLACADAHVATKDIDGLIRHTFDSSGSHDQFVANLGIERMRFWPEVPQGGAGAPMALLLADLAIQAGQADIIVCYRSYTPFDIGQGARYSPWWIFARNAGMREFGRPYGYGTLAQIYALMFERHIHEYGTTEAQLGEIVAACRLHASMNPRALRPTPITVEQYLDRPYVCGRFREDDLLINPSIGACAIVVMSAERATDLGCPPVHVAAAVGGSPAGGMPNWWEWWSLRDGPITQLGDGDLARRLYARAGITVDEIDVAQIYDCFSFTLMGLIEEYGFCGRGEAGPFVENGNIALGGQLPVNTHGGLIGEAYIHGFNHVLEGVRQIRGTSSAQVENAQVCLVTGAAPGVTSGMILTKEPTR